MGLLLLSKESVGSLCLRRYCGQERSCVTTGKLLSSNNDNYIPWSRPFCYFIVVVFEIALYLP